jgi:hypothetical protein
MGDSDIFSFHVMAKQQFHLLGTFQPSEVCLNPDDASVLLWDEKSVYLHVFSYFGQV